MVLATIRKTVCFAVMCLLVSRLCLAEDLVKVDAMVYYVPVSYSGSVDKDSAIVHGVYGYYGKGDRSYEAAVDFTRIEYITGPDFTQKDFTFAVTEYGAEKSSKYGAHMITSNIDTNDGLVLFGGMDKVYKKDKNLKVDVAFSIYDNWQDGVNVLQLSPAIGKTVHGENGTSTYMLTTLNLIHLMDDAGLHEKDFFSIEESVTWYRDKLSVNVHGWIGKQAFKVGSGGFVVYNKAEEHESGYGLSVKYSLPDNYNLSLGVDRESFKDFGVDNNVDATKYVVSIGHTF